MTARNTFVKQAQVSADSPGFMSISVYKQTITGSGNVINQVHRISIEAGDDVVAILAANNESLATMGYPAIDTTEFDLALAMRQSILDMPEPLGAPNPICSVEVNTSGGMRLRVKAIDEGSLEEDRDARDNLVIGPFDDPAVAVAKFNEGLAASSCVTILPEHIEQALEMRAASHAHPVVQERMRLEAERLEAERLKAEEVAAAQAETARLAKEDDLRRQEEKAARIEAKRLAAEEEAARVAEQLRLAEERIAAVEAERLKALEVERIAEEERRTAAAAARLVEEEAFRQAEAARKRSDEIAAAAAVKAMEERIAATVESRINDMLLKLEKERTSNADNQSDTA